LNFKGFEQVGSTIKTLKIDARCRNEKRDLYAEVLKLKKANSTVVLLNYISSIALGQNQLLRRDLHGVKALFSHNVVILWERTLSFNPESAYAHKLLWS
jgi:hypothetical protein